MRKQELHPRTAIINKTQKNQFKKARSQALSWLATTFPAVFDNSVCIRPLKIGIIDDILLCADKAAEAGISKSKLRAAVVLFTRRIDYLTCLKAREIRVDLQGAAQSTVTKEEAEHAAAKIKKRVEKSVRNARKIMAENGLSQPGATRQNTSNPSKSATYATPAAEDYLPIYPARAPALSTHHASAPATRTTAVAIRHKTTRQYDPSAVARLKEKLGLSRNAEKKEITE
ncbi:MAG: ProQ/FinO family protein [Legionellales bacterium]